MSDLKWHYGIGAESDRMVHSDCGGEVLYIDGGYICLKCNDQDDCGGKVYGDVQPLYRFIRFLWDELKTDIDAFSNIATIREVTGQNFGAGDKEINAILGERLSSPSSEHLETIREIRRHLGID